MLHGLLPTRDRLHRILPTVANATCLECDEQDSLKHVLAECSATRPVLDWMLNALGQFDSSLNTDTLITQTDHHQSAVKWLLAGFLGRKSFNC